MPHANSMTRHNALTPGMPARFERLRFLAAPAGPEGTPGAPADPAPKGDTPKDDPADKPLGPNGEKALTAEREARKDLERTVATMQQSQKDQMAALAAALGVKPDAKDDGTALIATLQKQVADMQRESLVYRVAAAHNLTATDDIDFLKSAKDEDTMTKLAVRLAANAAADEKPGTPKPDLTQGGKGGGPAKPDAKPGMDRLRQAYSTPPK